MLPYQNIQFANIKFQTEESNLILFLYVSVRVDDSVKTTRYKINSYLAQVNHQKTTYRTLIDDL